MRPGAKQFHLLLLAFVVGLASAEESFRWISPSADDNFGSGDSVVAKWTCGQELASPSFRLCQASAGSSVSSRGEDTKSGSGSCGTSVYPTVQQGGGVCFVSLVVPEIPKNETYTLQMIDGSGKIYSSPTFSLSSSRSSLAPRPNEQSPPVTDGGAQVPMAVKPTAPVQDSQAQLVTVTSVPIVIPGTNMVPGLQNSNFAASRPSTVAWAVPVSIAGAVILAAVFFAFRQHRIWGAERKADMERVHEALKSYSEKPQAVNTRLDDVDNVPPVGKNLNNIPSVPNFGFGHFPSMHAFPIPLFMPPAGPSSWSVKELYDRYTPPPPRYGGRSTQRSSRSPSVRSQVSSQYSASSRPLELLDNSSVSSFPHPLSLSTSSSCSSRSSRTRVCLPPIEAGKTLYDELRLQKLSESSSEGSESAITSSVLEDYVLPAPPPCLVPAPQRARDESPVEEEKLINPYDAVAASLKNARRT